MNVIDLAAFRARRDHSNAVAQAYADNITQLIGDLAIEHADRAFAVSGALKNSDNDLALIINRGVLRKLRSELRTFCRRSKLHAVEPVALTIGTRAYSDRLLTLETKQGKSEGLHGQHS